MTLSLNLVMPTYAELRKEREGAQAQLQAEAEKRRRASQKRSYEAAKVNRLTNDWTTVNTSANFEMRRNLRVLRARSRNLARNNDYIKRFLSMVRSNVAGPDGIKLQVRAKDERGTLNQLLNRKVEKAWRLWSRPKYASASGRLSWRDCQRKFCTTLARDGEVLVRMMAMDNPFAFSLKFISVDWLDENYNERLPNGNRVIMSVEVDDNDRPVAYWLTPPPMDLHQRTTTIHWRTRVPASEIIHTFLPDDENSDDDSQTRGVPWLHTAMKRLHTLGEYEEAELVAARVGACKMGIITEPAAADPLYGGDDDEDNPETQLLAPAQPGQFLLLEKGQDFMEFDPKHPGQNYGPFIKAVLRGVASGLDVSYFSLANDLEGVNYSSARIGLLEERDNWRALQNFQIEHFNEYVYIAWLKSSIMTGSLDISVRDLLNVSEPTWQPRGWKWVDPLKEISAKVLAINNGLETRTDTVAEQGGDFSETVATLAGEQALLESSGVKLLTEKAGTAAAPDPNDDDEDDQGDQGKDNQDGEKE